MLRFYLLGGSQISRDDRQLAPLLSAKSRALLCYLGMLGRPQPRMALASLFWGEKSDAQALVNLRQAVHQIREVLPGAILSTRTSVGIAPGQPTSIDTQLFAQQAILGLTGDQAALRAALDLYQGDLLADLYIGEAPAFDEWVYHEREWLRGLAIRGLRAIVAHAVAQREISAGLHYARRLLTLEPWLEEAHRQLIQLLDWDGQTGAAIAQYERCRRLLAAELGVVPGAETEALYQAIRARHNPPAAPVWAIRAAPRHNLPAQVTSFVGREDELADLARRLRPPASVDPARPPARLITLTGTGGVGKTRLALQVAEALRDAFPQGVYLVELAPLADPAHLPAAVAAALGLSDRASRALPDQLADYLADRRVLLILDNCEHLLDACAQLANMLLRACPGLYLLATSREALLAAGERRYPVRPLPIPDQGQLPALATAAAQLFIERAMALEPDLAIAEPEALAIAQICRRLDGLPLAIELAAAQIVAMPLDQIAARIGAPLDLLVSQRRTPEPRHQTLYNLIAWSVGMLSAAERALFYRLAVFAGGWTEASCAAICADPPGGAIAAQQVPELLHALAEKSLVLRSAPAAAEGRQPPGPDAGGRYDLLETIRQYAGEQLRQSGEEQAIRARHLAHFLALAEAAEIELTGPRQKAWLDRLDADLDNIRVALAWARETNPDDGGRLAGALGQFWQARGHFSEGRAALDQALAAASPLPSRWRARALSWGGRLANRFAERERSMALLGEGLAMSRAVGDLAGAAMALNFLGVVVESTGAFAEAQRMFEESLALYRSIEHHWGCTLVLINLAQGARVRSDYGATRRYAEESLRLQRQIGDQRGIGLSLDALGEVATIQGDFATAQRDLDEALAIQQTIGDRQGIVYSLTDLGQLALMRGDLAAARSWLEQSLTLKRELGSKADIACSLCYLGAVALAEGQAEAARQLLEQSLAMQQQVGIQSDIAYTRYYLGLAALALGDLDEAHQQLDQSLEIQREVRDRNCVAACLVGLGELAIRAGAIEQGVRLTAAAAGLRARGGIVAAASEHVASARVRAAAQAQLSPVAFAAAWERGYAAELDQALGSVTLV